MSLMRQLEFVNHFSKHETSFCITFIQCWSSVEDVGPTLCECYTDVLCLLGYVNLPKPFVKTLYMVAIQDKASVLSWYSSFRSGRRIPGTLWKAPWR